MHQLDRQTQGRRIAAARVLRGLERADLSEMFVAEGFGKHDIPRLERGDPDLRLTRPRWETLARLLRVPEAWFTASDADLFDLPETQLDRIEHVLDDVAQAVRQSRDEGSAAPQGAAAEEAADVAEREAARIAGRRPGAGRAPAAHRQGSAGR